MAAKARERRVVPVKRRHEMPTYRSGAAGRLQRQVSRLWKVGSKRSMREAFNLLKEAVASGHIESIASLGSCYDYGLGVPRQPEKAFLSYMAAACAGHAGATYSVAACVAGGIGVKPSLPGAVHWLRLAARRGSPEAIYRLAILYLDGHFGAHRRSYGKRLMQKAVELGVRPTTGRRRGTGSWR